MKCDAKTFFGVINAFRSLNLFSLLPLSRQEYMVMFVIAGQRKSNGLSEVPEPEERMR